MKTLLVTCRTGNGSEKTYRFSAEHGRFVVGSSRKADLRLPKTAQVIEGVIEKDENGWSYHSFAIADEKTPIIFDLSKVTEIKVADTTLKMDIRPDVSFFSAPLEMKSQPPHLEGQSKDGTGTTNAETQQVILVYFGGELLTTRYCETGGTCVIDLYTSQIQVKTFNTKEWVAINEGAYQIRHKSIAHADLEAYKVPLKELFPAQKHDRFLGAGLLATLLIGVISSFFAPGPTQFRAENEPPKTSPLVVKLSPTQQRKAPKAVEAQQQTTTNSGAPANKMDRLKNLASFGKAGLFLKKAVRMPASIGPNGKLALAAAGVGRLEGPTTDWNAMAGSKVSGKVGGGGLSGGNGTGTSLSAGSTGGTGLSLLDQEGEVSGGLDKEVIAAFIRKNIGHILYCYERSLSVNPNLFGKVSVKFTIAGNGAVATQKIGESTLRNGTVESCILEKISRWKFPEPKGGVQVVVTYPFLFKTTN